jgi:hypothetical protein
VRDGLHLPAPHGDGDIAVQIGAQCRHAQLRELGQQHRRRLAVVVVGSHADHADRGVYRREERGIGVSRAVVRHLEHVRAQILAGPEQPVLLLDLGVAAEHDPDTVDGGHQHERGVVRV